MTTSIKGVDTIDHTLTGATLKAHGYAFVSRYYAGGASKIGKEITRAEIVEKSAAGVRIVSNWELMEAPPNTRAEGKAHANAFLAQHKDVGGPDGVFCYYSIDTAAKAGAWDNYARGWADVLTPERLGVYGDGALFRALKKAGLITKAWQSMSKAFPGQTDAHGNWDHSGADVIQTGRGTVAGHNVDFNTALVADYGGWLLGETQPNQEDDMQLTDKIKVWNGEELTVESLLGKIYTRTGAIDPDTSKDLAALMEAVNAKGVPVVDVDGLAAKLAPLVNGATVDSVKAGLAEVLGGTHLVVTPPAS